MKIVSVVGARPNFMKIAPFVKAITQHNATPGNQTVDHLLVHTGQHYDDRMSKQFFERLNIPEADINLGVGSGSHAQQVGQTMIEFEKVLKQENPDWVVVLGDVNATLACSVTAKKEHIKVCHIEAGLRSGDIKMPEEVNRLVTDRLSDLLLTPDELSNENLRQEGTTESRISFVGNIMIDTLEANRDKASKLNPAEIVRDNLHQEKVFTSGIPELKDDQMAVMTMHRPSNVDYEEILTPIIEFLLDRVCLDFPLIWPIHPRAEKQLKLFGLWDKVLNTDNFILLKPLGYHEMLRLNMGAKVILTDSGGLQEECTILGTPCMTLRLNTERPITLTKHGGVSVLVGNNIHEIRVEYEKALERDRKPVRPPLWDGQTAGRCLETIISNSPGKLDQATRL